MRKPSLHIVLDDLQQVLVEKFGYTKKRAESFCNKLIIEAQPYQVKYRNILIANKKNTQTKLSRANKAQSNLVDKFNRLLVSVRQKQGHKAITVINKGSVQYPELKEVTVIAEEFTKLFGFSSVEIGFVKFIEIGLKFMTKGFSLSRYKYYKEKIFNYYESKKVIHDDNKLGETKRMYEIWKELIEKSIGFTVPICDIPDKYVNFVYARQEADEYKADYLEWLTAQFFGLAWLNVLPEYSQLHGNEAELRYQKYMFHIKKSKKEVEYESEAEKNYWEHVLVNS